MKLSEELGFGGTRFQWVHRHTSSSGSGSNSAADSVISVENFSLPWASVCPDIKWGREFKFSEKPEVPADASVE